MSIVDWGDRDVTITHEINSEHGKEVLLRMLKYDAPVYKWEGTTVFGTKTKNRKAEDCRVELRKCIGNARVLIRVGHVEEHNMSRWGRIDPERDVTIGTGSKMHFLPEEITEMSLAIAEARDVLENHIKTLKE